MKKFWGWLKSRIKNRGKKLMIQIKFEYNFNNNLGSLWVTADSIDQANAIAKTLLRRKYGSTEDLGYLLDMYITEIKVKSKINGK